jgi:hypothetical protein
MIKKFLIAGAALAAIAAYTVTTQPVQAGSCAVVTGKGRGLNDANATDRSMKHLKNVIGHWAHKNGYKKVKVGKAHTTCAKKGPLSSCKSSAKVCG